MDPPSKVVSSKSPRVYPNPCLEGPAFFGFSCGPHPQPGCLTSSKNVRLHSCEHGTTCPALDSSDTIFISPIISRTPDGEVISELGAGNGGSDHGNGHEIEAFNIHWSKKFTKPRVTRVPDFHGSPTGLKNVDKVLLSGNKTSSIENILQGEEDSSELSESAQHLAQSSSPGGNQHGNPAIRKSSTPKLGLGRVGTLPARIVNTNDHIQKASTDHLSGLSVFPTLFL